MQRVMFWTLIRKELRLHRTAIMAAVITALLLEVVVPAIFVCVWVFGGGISAGTTALDVAVVMVERCSAAALVLTCLFAAIFGGTSLPLERHERWSDQQGMLPVGRPWIALAKLVTGAALTVTMFLVHAIVWSLSVQYLAERMPYGLSLYGWQQQHVGIVAAIAFALFCTAWLVGTVVKSPAITVALAFGIVVGALFVAILDSNRIHYADFIYSDSFLPVMQRAGLIAIVLGTTNYLRRVAP